MYLIYVSAKDGTSTPDNKERDLPEHDLQPIMLALTRPNQECFLREADTRELSNDKPDGFADIERIFVRLRACDDDEDGTSIPSPDELEDSIDTGDAKMAVALATIYFDQSAIEPMNVNFIDHVKERTRLADSIVVAGYTDSECTMTKSEQLGLQRALAVRQLLSNGGIDVPMVAIARPKCCFGNEAAVSRRVEVTAIFNGPNDQDHAEQSKQELTDKVGEEAATESSDLSAVVATLGARTVQ